MKRGKASPERNGKPSITIHVKTRSPFEAFNLLRQGHPIDLTAGYYDQDGTIPEDFWMMDKTAKLHFLADLRQQEKDLKTSMDQQTNEIQKLIEDEQNKEATAKAAAITTQTQPVTQGQVS